jgi:hypothetical protein
MGIPFDELPRLAQSGLRHSWDVWGPGDNLGTLNRLTPQVVAAAASCVRTGERIGLSLPLEEPAPPLFGRKAMSHVVVSMGGDVGWDDWVDGFYLQSSSQWDSLRHVKGPDGFYGGWQGDPSRDPGPLGIHHWAGPGIIGRGVLIDLAGLAAGGVGGGYDPFTTRRFTPGDIEGALAAQGARLRPGDILCVRTGWTDKYLALDAAGKEAMAAGLTGPMGHPCAGLSGGEEMSRFLWDSGAAAVAADNPAVEAVPMDLASGSLHARLIPSLGFAIGELFDFAALAAACHADGRYDFLFASVPLNVAGGVGSPANAVAVRLRDARYRSALPRPGGQDGQVQRHEGVLKLRELLGAVGADPAPHQLGRRPGEGDVRVVGHERPLGMLLQGPVVPLAVDLGEPVHRGLEPVDGRRARGRHVDVEDARERGLLGEELQERVAPGPQHVLGGRVVRHRASRRQDLVDEQLPAGAGRVEEAVILALVVRVERDAGHARPADDVGDGHVAVPVLGDRRDDGTLQSLPLGSAYLQGGQAAAAPGQSGPTLVSPGKTAFCGPLRAFGHGSIVSGKSQKYSIVL